MKLDRREFLKIAGLSAAGMLIALPQVSQAYLPKYGQLPLLCNNIPESKMKIVGIGRAGCRYIGQKIASPIKGVGSVMRDLDFLNPRQSLCKTRTHPKERLLNGLSLNLDLTARDILEGRNAIRRYLKGSEVILIVAGLGGTTSSAAAPIVAQVSREIGAWTLAVVTMPFALEGLKRKKNAQKGLERLKYFVDTLVTIQGDAILKLLPPWFTLVDCYRQLDDTVASIVSGFSKIFQSPEILDPAFSDFKKIFSQIGIARAGVGIDKANDLMNAANQAFYCSQLHGAELSNAKKVLGNITLCGRERIRDIQELFGFFQQKFSRDAEVFIRTTFIKNSETEVFIVAGGLS